MTPLRTTALVAGVLYLLTFVSIVALAGVGTAVALYPVLKRQNEGLALGFVGARVLVGAGILAGVACLLSIVSLRQAGAGTGALATGQTLAILYDRIFLLSQSLMPAVNDLLLGLVLYPSRLVPRLSPHSRSRSLSSRWGCIWSSRASSPLRSSQPIREMPE